MRFHIKIVWVEAHSPPTHEMITGWQPSSLAVSQNALRGPGIPQGDLWSSQDPPQEAWHGRREPLSSKTFFLWLWNLEVPEVYAMDRPWASDAHASL